MNAELLCAGLGTRFRPTTDRVAKPALPFLNLPQLAYSLVYLESLGLENLVINTHHLPQTVESAVRGLTKASGGKYNLHFSNETKILGSGGGIKNNAAQLTGENFLVINGDEIILFNHDYGLKPLIDFHRQSGALATLLTTDHPAAGLTLGGVWANADGLVTKLGGTDPNRKEKAQHFTGVFIFSERVFKYMPAHSLPFHIFNHCLEPAMIRGEKVFAYHDPSLLWLETTDLNSYLESTQRALIELGQDSVFGRRLNNVFARFGFTYERIGEAQWVSKGSVFNGALNPGSFLLMGPESYVDANVEVRDFAVLGADSRVMQGLIESSVIAPGVHINEMTSLRRQLIV